MLRELCPAGVEYRPLKDLCKIKEKETITKGDLIDGGKYPVINSSREILGYYSKCNNEGDTLVLTSHGAHAGFCHYMREPFFAGALCYPMQTSDVSVITTKFLYYLLKNGENHIRENFVNRSGVPYVNFKALMSYELPLPPLPSQDEIVRILDAFTSLTAELTAELTARKRQYAYYRDRLLTFGDEVPRVRLGEVCRFQNGFAFKSETFLDSGFPILRITNISDGRLSDEGYMYFSPDDYKENLDNYIVKPGNIIVAMSGATTGKIGYNYSNNEYYLNQRVGMFLPVERNLNNRFLYHWLLGQSRNILAISSGTGAQPNLSSVKMMKLKIPLPPLPEQNRIAAILDRFDALCNDLADGLPAEIAARKKQYAYYRDKLLTFQAGK